MAESADTSGVDTERESLLGVLARHDVEFVLIGGAAIQSYGRHYDTQDIDLTPDTDPDNLARLADALNELDCRLVTDPADTDSWVALPADYFTPRSLLAATVWNLATRHGQLDLTFTPTGFPGGYSDLAPRATQRAVAGTAIVVSIAALEDVHESKRQADRPKDREYFRQAEAQ
jgi:hypothetical protein